MNRLFVAVALLTSIGATQAQTESTNNPYDVTVRGNIGQTSQENYRQSLKECYNGKAEALQLDDKLVSCLKQRVKAESAQLDAVYKGTIDYLKAQPAAIARLQQAERAWATYQNTNCQFASATAGPSKGEMQYLDCMLRSTIDRWTELRSLVGD